MLSIHVSSRLAVRQPKQAPEKTLPKTNYSQLAKRLSEILSNNGSDPFYYTIAAVYLMLVTMLCCDSPLLKAAASLTFFTEAFTPLELVKDNTPMRHEKVVNERLKLCIDDKGPLNSAIA